MVKDRKSLGFMIIDIRSGEMVDVCFQILEASDVKKYGLMKKNGWFNWINEFQNVEKNVFGMFIKGKDEIEGVISLEESHENQLIHIGLMESAPKNKFKHPNQMYASVGKNLLCFAMHYSFLNDFEGYVGLEAKMNKNETYYSKLGAINSRGGIPPYYYFRTDNSSRLLDQFMPGGVQWCPR